MHMETKPTCKTNYLFKVAKTLFPNVGIFAAAFDMHICCVSVQRGKINEHPE